MLPQDPGSALVRIFREKDGPQVGAGFVCCRGEDTLILTSRSAIENAMTGPVWIDGSYSASCLFVMPFDARGGELAVLRSANLPKRSVLQPLRQGFSGGETRIFSYYTIRDDKPWIRPFKFRSTRNATIRMSNDPDREYRISELNRGSPVLDGQNRVVAVVTAVDRTIMGDPEERDAIVVAGLVDQLMTWTERPPHLFTFQEIFVSYSRSDGELVERVVDALRRDGFRVWLDVDMLGPGDVWTEQLTNVLQSAQFAMLFCSPNSPSRPWVRKEMNLLQTRLASPDPPLVLPVLLKGGQAPFAWNDIQTIDLRDENIDGCVAAARRAIAKHQTRAVPLVRGPEPTADVPA